MNTIATLTLSNIKMFVRNRQTLFFTLFMPVIIMTVFGLIGFDQPQKINVGIALNAPPSAGTSAFVASLKEIPAFSIFEGTEREERNAVRQGDRSVVFLIPHNLIPDQGEQVAQAPVVSALINDGEQQQAQTAITIVSQILDRTTLNVLNAPELFSLEAREVNARNLTYFDFLLPGVVALSIMQMSVFSVSFVFADYREKGILKRLMATPMKPHHFVAANVVTRMAVAVIQAAVLILIGVLLFGAHVEGSFPLILVAVLLGSIMFIGLGFAVSGIAKTVESVPAIANIIVFPMLFLGGTFFPITAMPDWLQNIVQYMPLTYLSHSLREVMTQGAAFADISNDLVWMVIWSLILVAFATYTFRFSEKDI
jgi:ABC-2 type transport system permease protein